MLITDNAFIRYSALVGEALHSHRKALVISNVNY